MKRVGVITVARSDYSILRCVMREIQSDPALTLEVVATGMHLSPAFGHTVDEIETAGFPIVDRIEMLLSSDTPEGTAKSIGLALIGFGQLYTRWRPDLLIIMGDRFEMFAAASAAIPFRIPIAHLHGGETSEGAIDETFRHAITKMSHIHFVSNTEARDRVIQMGEDPSRVIVSGAPGLDNLNVVKIPSRTEMEEKFSINLRPSPLLVTFHPTTFEPERTVADTAELLSALEQIAHPVIFTASNADADGYKIQSMIEEFVARTAYARLIPNFGADGYYAMMRFAAALVGNSSSGIIEAASFGLPVVNIGNRQKGRLAGRNVIHTAPESSAIRQAVAKALDSGFRQSLEKMENPYGDGKAARRIVETIHNHPLDSSFCIKSFHSLERIGR